MGQGKERRAEGSRGAKKNSIKDRMSQGGSEGVHEKRKDG